MTHDDFNPEPNVATKTDDFDVQQNDMRDRVRDEAEKMTQRAKQEAQSLAQDQKARAADRVDTYAEALRQTSDELRQQNQDTAARYVDRAADELSQLSSYVEQHSVDQMIDDVSNFARQQPELFVAGAFALGTLAARFIKALSGGSNGNRSYPYGQSPSQRQFNR